MRSLYGGNNDDETDNDDYDQVRRFPMIQPLLLDGIQSKVGKLFPAVAEQEVFLILIVIGVTNNVKIIFNMVWKFI